MVKHGRSKKRRAGRIGRTKLKNHTYRRFKPPQYTDDTVKKHWDPNKSPSANMQSLGLVSTLNNKLPKSSTHPTQEEMDNTDSGSTVNVVELFDIPDSDALSTKKKLPLGTNDQVYIAKCMTRHGDDYLAMARDIKTNVMQHTQDKLRKMGARFLLLTPEQRKVPVPDKVPHLVLET